MTVMPVGSRRSRIRPKVLLVGKNHETMRILVMALRGRGYSAVPVTTLSAALQMLDYSGLSSMIIDMAHLDFEMASIFGGLQHAITDRGLPVCAIVPDDLETEELQLISETVPALITHKGNLEDSALRAVRNVQIQTKRTTIIRRRRGPKILDMKVRYYPLPEVMQFLEQRRSDGLLELIDDTHTGEIYYRGGLIYHSALDEEVEGMDAVMLMLHLRDGALSFYNDTWTDKKTIENGSTMILLDALRRNDEMQLIVDASLAKRVRRVKTGAEQGPPPPVE